MIITNLDVLLARRKMSLQELSERIDISVVNLSKLKTVKVRAIRFSTLDAICRVLECQAGDILEFRPDQPEPEEKTTREQLTQHRAD